MVYLMLFSVVFNYCFALAIEKYRYRKLLLAASVLYNLGILFVFKYLGFSINIINILFQQNFSVWEIALPVGISFYTFQAMSYVVDVYRGTADAQHNILNLALYISLFPQLVAGPIVRYHSVAAQIQNRNLDLGSFGDGAKRFMRGFCKKVILANNLADAADFYFGNQPAGNSVLGAWIGSICFSLQIFYDFSGYSDMAIGLGKMLGFTFEENFNYPYMAGSVTDFWRRWHISLSTWFRDYVYIPLGGSKVPAHRHICNMAVVWVLTGIWHGAAFSFAAWGFFYFAALVIEKYFIKPDRSTNRIFHGTYRILVLLYVNFGWVIFRAEGLRSGIKYGLSMLGFYYKNPFYDPQAIRILREYGAFLILGLLFLAPAACWGRVAAKRIRHVAIIEKYIVPIGYLVGFLWAVSFLVLGAHNPFIYFNF